MDDKRMVKSITDSKPLVKKAAKGKIREIRIDDILDDMKIMRMTNWVTNTGNR